MNSNEGFLERWTRRKAEARASPETVAAASEPPPAEPAAAPAGPEPTVMAANSDMLRQDPPDDETRAAWIARLETIDLETLTYQDDFTVFLRSWVPQALRNRALRRLWRTDDVLAVLDGLNDYDEDYSIAADAVGTIKSSWQPGRGFALAEDEPAEAAPDTEIAPGRPDDAVSADPQCTEQAPGDDDDSTGDERPPAARAAADTDPHDGSNKASG